MGLETLDSTKPTGAEFLREGDDSIRSLKAMLLAFAGIAHHLDGSHKIGIGPAASRPAAGKAGNLWILTLAGSIAELQWDTGTIWSGLTSNQALLDVLNAFSIHSTSKPIDHSDKSITGAKIDDGTLVARNFDINSDATSVAPLVNGGDADSLHRHILLENMRATLPDMTAGNYLVFQNDAERFTVSTLPDKKKELKLGVGGTLRIKFTIWNTPNVPVYARIRRNNLFITGEPEIGGNDNATEYSRDVSGWTPGDTLQVYVRTGNQANAAYISNLRIYVGQPPVVGALINY